MKDSIDSRFITSEFLAKTGLDKDSYIALKNTINQKLQRSGQSPLSDYKLSLTIKNYINITNPNP